MEEKEMILTCLCRHEFETEAAQNTSCPECGLIITFGVFRLGTPKRTKDCNCLGGYHVMGQGPYGVHCSVCTKYHQLEEMKTSTLREIKTSTLKDPDIRSRRLTDMDKTFRTVQAEMRDWMAHNFPDACSADQFEGVVEEVGELARARLKHRQGIRGGDWLVKEKDAVVDIFVFLMNYCNTRDFDFEELLVNVWGEVQKRDWIKYPKKGVEES